MAMNEKVVLNGEVSVHIKKAGGGYVGLKLGHYREADDEWTIDVINCQNNSREAIVPCDMKSLDLALAKLKVLAAERLLSSAHTV